MTPLYPYDRTQKLGLNHVDNSLSFTSSPNSFSVLSILLRKRLMCLHFPMSTTSALVQSLLPFNCQSPSNGSLISTQGVLFPSSRPLPPSLTVAKLSMTLQIKATLIYKDLKAWSSLCPLCYQHRKESFLFLSLLSGFLHTLYFLSFSTQIVLNL